MDVFVLHRRLALHWPHVQISILIFVTDDTLCACTSNCYYRRLHVQLKHKNFNLIKYWAWTSNRVWQRHTNSHTHTSFDTTRATHFIVIEIDYNSISNALNTPWIWKWSAHTEVTKTQKTMRLWYAWMLCLNMHLCAMCICLTKRMNYELSYWRDAETENVSRMLAKLWWITIYKSPIILLLALRNRWHQSSPHQPNWPELNLIYFKVNWLRRMICLTANC